MSMSELPRFTLGPKLLRLRTLLYEILRTALRTKQTFGVSKSLALLIKRLLACLLH